MQHDGPLSRFVTVVAKMDDNADSPTPGSDNRTAEHKGRSVPLFDFEELFGNQSVVLIRLGDQVYELRRTRTGKLVLNK